MRIDEARVAGREGIGQDGLLPEAGWQRVDWTDPETGIPGFRRKIEPWNRPRRVVIVWIKLILQNAGLLIRAGGGRRCLGGLRDIDNQVRFLKVFRLNGDLYVPEPFPRPYLHRPVINGASHEIRLAVDGL
jgi:hypothetical protein